MKMLFFTILTLSVILLFDFFDSQNIARSILVEALNFIDIISEQGEKAKTLVDDGKDIYKNFSEK